MTAAEKMREMRVMCAGLTRGRDRALEIAEQEMARANAAERQLRDTARELDRWQERARRAEAALASMSQRAER